MDITVIIDGQEPIKCELTDHKLISFLNTAEEAGITFEVKPNLPKLKGRLNDIINSDGDPKPSEINGALNFLSKLETLSSKNHVESFNEGSAISIGIGHYLATKKIPCVYQK